MARVYGTRPDATGRSSGKVAGKRWRKLVSPPEGEPFIWHTREMLTSPAWRAMSINCRRLLDALEVDHMNHAGTENGNLMATYDQLREYGCPRSEIRAAVDEAVFLGLVKVKRGGRWAESNQPSTYRLTYYADRDGRPATNEWKGKTVEAIAAWKEDRARLPSTRHKRSKKQNAGTDSRTTVVRFPELPDRKAPKVQ